MGRCWVAAAVLLLTPRFLPASILTVDFEAFNDGEILTNQIPGLTFASTVVFTAGISLNEFDFPPRFGVNVASDL